MNDIFRKVKIPSTTMGCIFLCLITCGLVSLGGWTLDLISRPDTREKTIIARIDSPATVVVDERFTIEIHFETVAGKETQFGNVFIPLDYLKGIKIEDSNLPYTTKTISEIVNAAGFELYDFQGIPVNKLIVIKLFALAVKAGDYSGSINVCEKKTLSLDNECLDIEIKTSISLP